jgi:hypothetical protein
MERDYNTCVMQNFDTKEALYASLVVRNTWVKLASFLLLDFLYGA